MANREFYIGLMSGTSMDAVDTALVQFTDNTLEVVAYEQFPIEQNLKAAVRALNTNSSLEEVTEYDVRLGHLFADSVNEILRLANIPAEDIIAVGSHGQTILHLPDATYPRTLQIGDPNIIAQKTGITAVADFRRRDIASGGQGAPLAPGFHNFIFRNQQTNRLILNLGGIANFTVLPKNSEQSILGFDTGPGNGLLDDWNRRNNGSDMDRDSNWAATGQIDMPLLDKMLADPFLKLPPPKSTGRDCFNMGWINNMLASINHKVEAANVQATLLELTTRTIADAALLHASQTNEIYLCGGGAHNQRMVARLKELLPSIIIEDTGKLGVDPDAVEAVCFAWLAKQTIDRQSGNEPSVTGAAANVILGGVYWA